ncbi:ATP-dependent zinc metalloprotease FtsH [Flavobacterium aurantiibacter]|uniref:ATP-dependent zinc metalloprotease FtsH n=1 Tax=Flavobacterium aurantiibacter TaxID=2023067 RepID=A0A255ZMP1_9FLAO|nr:ATP-dependent zinc metalloprotease FtsH [Flavobacterium aurantiibacter]OYQ42778.1 peptidase M41 [Flavobacterium aurantiibacter]
MSKENNSQPRKIKFNPMWLYAALVGFLVFLYVTGSTNIKDPSKISTSTFRQYLEMGLIDRVVVYNTTEAEVYLNAAALKQPAFKDVAKGVFGAPNGPHFYLDDIGDGETFQKNLENAVAAKKLKDYNFEKRSDWGEILSFLFPIIIIVIFWLYIMRRMSAGGAGGPGGQIFNIGKSKARLFDEKSDIKITFKDVAGLEGAKEEIQEIVEFLKNPERYTNLGGKIPKGALLVGPPGTGKTLLAKAVAGEARVPFFSLSGSDFVEMFVGVGASRVRDLFKQAKEKSPAIIFIDEIDAVGRARGKNSFSGGNDERENTLNQLLTEMDGFGTNSNVIVLAATNRSDVLDKALMRAGRFDRQIFVDLPDIRERKEIFEVHLKPLKKVEDLDTDFLAKQTPGFSGADIANVCNEAALIAARKNKPAVDKQDFLDAVDRIVGGLEKKNKIITKEEKRAIAIHEAGHATVSWMLEHAAPLVKVTIVPRGQSLGAAWYLPEERQIVRPDQMLDEMCATMGGRAAEKVTFDTISTGALSDLEKVTRQARAMVTIFGLNDKIGNVTYYDSSGQAEYSFSKPYSEDTARVIDKEISDLIESQYQRAIAILEENKEKLFQLADILIEREVIFKDDLEAIFGQRQWQTAEEADKQL